MGLEVVVRPVVFPNIRPATARSLAPVDNPTQGIATIGGSGGSLIDLPHSWNVSVSQQRPHKETVRQFDKERVKQKDKAGNINNNNYVDVERLKRVRLETDDGPYKMLYADPPKVDNVETLETDVTRKADQ